MKFNKLTAATLVALMASATTFAAEGDPEPITSQGGTVNFSGSIVATPCVVSNSSQGLPVPLGDFQASKFDGIGSTSAPVQFDIELISCDTDTYKNATLTFKGISIEGNPLALAPAAVEASDTVAAGVGIQILQDSEVVNIDGEKSTEPFKLLDGDNKLSLQAQYIAVADNVGVGSANASADFLVTYQ